MECAGECARESGECAGESKECDRECAGEYVWVARVGQLSGDNHPSYEIDDCYEVACSQS